MANSDFSLLIIDDEDVVRESLAIYLSDCGYRVDEACDGIEGLEFLHQHRPDVVLCDLKMPRMGALGLLQAIATQSYPPPVLVISGVGGMHDVVEALRLGATDYLIKPILDLEVLDHSIKRCLEQACLRQENMTYRRQLENTNRELKESLLLLQQDQQAGRQVQLKMLPPAHKSFGDYHFSHKILPSLYLSGDFVDYFTVGEDFVVFFIADVSGHGASSAFVTVLLKNLFARKRSDYIHLGDPTILAPVEMLQVANRELLATEIGKHATLCVGVIDLKSNELYGSVAGHLPLPVLYRGERTEFLRAEGMPVGLFEVAEYHQARVRLPDEFVLTLFSDGVLEVLPPDGILAKEDCLLDKLKDGQNTIDKVVDALGLEQVAEAPDDIAILLISKTV